MFFGVNTGQQTEFLFKVPAKIFWVVKAYLVSNFGHRKLAFAKKLGGPFETDDADKLNRGFTCNGKQFFIQMHPAHRHFVAEISLGLISRFCFI